MVLSKYLLNNINLEKLFFVSEVIDYINIIRCAVIRENIEKIIFEKNGLE